MNSYKIQKYQHKISTYNGQTVPEIYYNKLSYYTNLIYGGKTKLAQPKSDKNCDSKTFILDNNHISACGYGLLTDAGTKSKLEPVVFDRRLPYDTDVVIQILYCGVCHSDWHSIIGEWSRKIPLIPGHEIAGQVIKIGTAVNKFKIGDSVGVGPYVNSCQQCARCLEQNQQYCINGTSSTYDSRDRIPGSLKPDGERTYGGFSNIITVNQDFVFKIPSNLPLDQAAPLLCAGVTVYSPLIRSGVGPGKKVAIAGIGGLGSVAVKIAKALGAEVLAITRTDWKLTDAKRIGADKTVLVKDMAMYNDTLDVIIDTIPEIHNINPYLDLLKFDGSMTIVGVFDNVDLDTSVLSSGRKAIRGSIVGGVREFKDLLQFCSKHNIVADIEKIKIKDINSTFKKIQNSKVKYRFVIEM